MYMKMEVEVNNNMQAKFWPAIWRRLSKRKGSRKDCVEIHSDEEASCKRRIKRWESKIKKELHQEDNTHLLESMRLVVSKVIINVIKEKKRV